MSASKDEIRGVASDAARNIGETQTIISGDFIVFAEVDYDEMVPNPLEDEDGNGTIYSFNRRHSNFIGYDKEDFIKELLQDPDAMKLGYYEHGLSSWFVSPDEGGSVAPGVEFTWDGARFAGIWVPDETARENLDTMAEGKDRREVRLKYVQAVCKQYTDWVNGHVYEYDVETYRLLHDEDGNPIEEEEHYKLHADPIDTDDSCGIYDDGDDYVESEVAAAIESSLKEAEKLSA